MERSFGSKYLLGEVIGRGAMGRVHRASLRDGSGDVAVKLLREDLATEPEVVMTFVRERDVLRAVRHPNVVRVLDLVIEGDELGIVMELVPAGHLRKAVPPPQSPAESALLLAQAADGLAAVHATGVVHRDVKPENVLVEQLPDGGRRLRLTDFGIARLMGSPVSTMTAVIGTPGYIAPEVARGQRATSAADVYALGVMLFEWSTGRVPFAADNAIALLRAHADDVPPRLVDAPVELTGLLDELLAKEPGQRPSAAQTAERLRALRDPLVGYGPFAVEGAPQPVRAVAPFASPASSSARAAASPPSEGPAAHPPSTPGQPMSTPAPAMSAAVPRPESLETVTLYKQFRPATVDSAGFNGFGGYGGPDSDSPRQQFSEPPGPRRRVSKPVLTGVGAGVVALGLAAAVAVPSLQDRVFRSGAATVYAGRSVSPTAGGASTGSGVPSAQSGAQSGSGVPSDAASVGVSGGAVAVSRTGGGASAGASSSGGSSSGGVVVRPGTPAVSVSAAPSSGPSQSAAAVPGGVASMSLSGATDTTLVLTWGPAPGATKYRVAWTESGPNGRSYSSKAPNYTIAASPLTLIGLRPGRTYTVRVTPFNAAGNGQVSVRTAATTGAPVPSAVPTMSLTNPTATTLVLTWSAAPGATRYKIGWTESGADGRVYDTAPPHYALSASPLTLINLRPGRKYTVRVTPYNASGDGPVTVRVATTSSA